MSCSSDRLPSPYTSTEVYAGPPSRTLCAVAVSRKASAAPGLVVLNAAMPTIVKSWLSLTITRSLPPRPSLAFFAVSASSTTWSGPCGAWPEVISTGLRGVSTQLPTMVGAPVVGPTFLRVAGSARVAFSTVT